MHYVLEQHSLYIKFHNTTIHTTQYECIGKLMRNRYRRNTTCDIYSIGQGKKITFAIHTLQTKTTKPKRNKTTNATLSLKQNFNRKICISIQSTQHAFFFFFLNLQ